MPNPRSIIQLTCIAALSFSLCSLAAFAQAVTPAETKAAIALYNQKQFPAAAAAFEKLIARQPAPTLLYYAALSSRGARREMRAQQLLQFLLKNYPNSAEAVYAKQILATMPGGLATAGATTAEGATAPSPSASDDTELPETVKSLVPAEMRAMLDTPEGRRAVKDAMAQNSDKIATIREAEKKGALTPKKVAAAIPRDMTPIAQNRGSGAGEHPFTPADIARDGANAIDQMRYPNCWFECSMGALAELPRGQRLLASMIRKRAEDTYVVRFPGDGVEYVITMDDLKKARIHDSALWASLIECAQTRKFPDNEGAEGATGDMSRLEVGLGCITGCKAEVLTNLTSKSATELSSFIGGAVKSQNPVVAGTWHAYYLASLPEICVPQHAYTITGFDPAHNMITIRNPHGKNSDSFSLDSDPKHEDFEQLKDGNFKMSVRVFQRYFHSVCRSFI